MADIQVLKQIYRRTAAIKAGASLPAQKAWLQDRFLGKAEDADEGSPEITGTGYKGQTGTTQFRGGTAEELAQALMLAMDEVDALIAAADADEDPPVSLGCLLPRVVCAPR